MDSIFLYLLNSVISVEPETFNYTVARGEVDTTDTLCHEVSKRLFQLPRFAGALHNEWTVGHHTVFVLDIAEKVLKIKDKAAIAGLMLHDTQELFTSDVPTPIKRILGLENFVAMEDALQGALLTLLGVNLSHVDTSEVRRVDRIALYFEAGMLPNITHREVIREGVDLELTPAMVDYLTDQMKSLRSASKVYLTELLNKRLRSICT